MSRLCRASLRAVALVALVGALVGSAGLGRQARAGMGDLRLTAEPGIGIINAGRSGRTLGVLGGGALGVALNDQMFLEVRFDRRHFHAYSPQFAATTGAIGATYALDIGAVRPFLEAGAAYVALSYLDADDAARRPALLPAIVPFLGVGFDTQIRQVFWLGIGFRYLPILESDLAGDPAYLTVSLRLSLQGRLGLFD